MGEIIRGNFVTEACKDRYDLVTSKSAHGWAPFPTQGMEDYFFEIIEEYGVDSDKSPSEIVDNALINGEWGNASDWGWTKREAKEKYEDCELLYYEDNGNDEDDDDDPYVILSL